jgi:hypothetical protein
MEIDLQILPVDLLNVYKEKFNSQIIKDFNNLKDSELTTVFFKILPKSI